MKINKLTVNLGINEEVGIVNKITGEFNVIQPTVSTDETQIITKMPWNKHYNYNWDLLQDNVDLATYAIANILAKKAKGKFNMIIEYGNKTTFTELGEDFGFSRQTIKTKINKLFELGVIYKMKKPKDGSKYIKYWLFNPYLANNSRYIKDIVLQIFKETTFGINVTQY